ncbi:squalene synthase HpnC [Aporhodopirellula aestuarii]|uniref:Squalene synthase HpnC n=1 Tax=Aporhodopirellula aestuarii TaxID=2950107 RepID=A0ABT0U8Y8_9BACT|nr:squalene synthase HpnC [Aporhodopirellula aestuarii]MCM2373380.1 squalene synthase HpnC [Aporhodopirellula aestuarii]
MSLPPPATTSAGPTVSQLAASRRQCRDIARSHYENFLVGSLLLPRRMRQPFFDVYAFCRTADDLADESESAAVASASLAKYRDCLARIYDDQNVEGLFIALADTIRQFRLPRQPFDDLLDAFVQDQTVHRYHDEDSLLKYCARSANPVGRLVLAMGESDSDENVRLSDEICTALQLANFWQDVARDYAIGRIYLPATVMTDHGFDETLIEQTIKTGQSTPRCFRDAIASQCARTRERFERGRTLPAKLPKWLAADIELFIHGGLATLDAIERIDCDVLRRRPTVSKGKQAYLFARALLRKASPGDRQRRMANHAKVAGEGTP